MKRFILLATICLAGCEASDRLDVMESAAPPPSSPPPMVQRAANYKATPDEFSQDEAKSQEASLQSFLAYRYGYSFRLPASSVEPVMESHMERCMEAGPNLCQVLNSSSNAYSEDSISARLSFRAAPDFLDDFSKEIVESVSDANGELASSNINVEDLTRQILDTDARLSAQTALRDRLQSLLETREAELADLLAVERELARVQSEIESATSILKALRQRVSMSEVNINYETKRLAVSSSALSPVGYALRDFVGNVANGLAAAIDFLAVILPWLLLIILPFFFLIRWLWRKRRKRTPAT